MKQYYIKMNVITFNCVYYPECSGSGGQGILHDGAW